MKRPQIDPAKGEKVPENFASLIEHNKHQVDFMIETYYTKPAQQALYAQQQNKHSKIVNQQLITNSPKLLVQAIGLMENDGFVIEFKAEVIELIKKDPAQLTIMPVIVEQSKPTDKKKQADDEEAKQFKNKI